MSQPLRVLLIAGEASGDLHGAVLVRALRRRAQQEVEVTGVGGERLRAAGMRILEDTAKVATMGFVETFGTLGRLVSLYRRLIRFMDEERPDVVVLVDYPEFNMLLAARARKRGIRVFYFIGPQVWAWRRGRARKIAARVDKMAVVFPFEPELYNELRPDGPSIAEFVGHPLVEEARATASRETTLARYGLDPLKTTLALLPGSRRKELKYLLPHLAAAAEVFAGRGWQVVLALAAGLCSEDVDVHLGGVPRSFSVVAADTYNVIEASDVAVVASGTATLETALLGCPMVIVYRVSRSTYWLARRLVEVEWIGMPNIVLQRQVFPELLQEAVTAEAIVREVERMKGRRGEMADVAEQLREKLSGAGADRAAELVLELVR